MLFIQAGVIVGMLSGILGCQEELLQIMPPNVLSADPFPIPRDVQCVSVLYPKSISPEMADTYNCLEEATFGLKGVRPSLKLVDQLYLPVVLKEHRFQLAGLVADESAV